MVRSQELNLRPVSCKSNALPIVPLCHLCASVTKQYNLVPAKGGDLFGWESNRWPRGSNGRYMTNVTCRLTAKKPYQLRAKRSQLSMGLLYITNRNTDVHHLLKHNIQNFISFVTVFVLLKVTHMAGTKEGELFWRYPYPLENLGHIPFIISDKTSVANCLAL